MYSNFHHHSSYFRIPSAKSSAWYDLQDITDAVQKWTSEFEMESDNITSSEEDVIENASEVDRENPNSTDSSDDENVDKSTNLRHPTK